MTNERNWMMSRKVWSGITSTREAVGELFLRPFWVPSGMLMPRMGWWWWSTAVTWKEKGGYGEVGGANINTIYLVHDLFVD
jgi:hypothetical protein